MSKKIEEELSSAPNDKYAKFFAKFEEIDTLPLEQWKVSHLLGYFCRKWKAHYNADYHWKFNNQNPTKCFEVWQMNVLGSKLSQSPQILRDYIDWVFINVVPKKGKLRSISFMTDDAVVIPYKMNVLLGGKKNLNIDRSTPLPANYQEVLKMPTGTNITTYGDLAFMSQIDPMPNQIALAIEKIIEMGFDMEILKRIV